MAKDLSSTPAVGVVVPCGGSVAELERCLDALGRQEVDFDFEVIVVDSFHNLELARPTARHGFARLVRGNDSMLEPGPARNLGVNHCNATYLAFSDADCAPDPGWLAAAVGALEQGAVIVTGPVTDLVKTPVAIADNFLQFVDFAIGRPRGRVSHAPGCNLALRRSHFLESGGFESDVGEDVRFSTAISSRHGTPICFEPNMKQRHAGRATLAELMAHHKSFGHARGEFGLLLSPWHERFGSYRLMAPMFAMRRYGYLVVQTARFAPVRLVLLVLLTPLLVVGLVAWALGFREGSLARRRRIGR